MGLQKLGDFLFALRRAAVEDIDLELGRNRLPEFGQRSGARTAVLPLMLMTGCSACSKSAAAARISWRTGSGVASPSR
ncbi:MAG: hypothetical protein WDO70_09355 [Alphaproteobacteria bacterium]